MSNMRIALLLALALTAPAFAGCLEIVDDPEDSTSPVKRSAAPKTVAPRATGTMTADETSAAATAELCGNVVIPPEQTYCATQVITLAGTMDGMTELPVTLDTFVGDIRVTSGSGSKWTVLVTLEARGESEADAIANLENIEFTWSHEGSAGHHLRAHAELKEQQSNRGEAASYQATLPADVKYFLTCDNAVGDMLVSNLKGSQIFLDSASGDLGATDVTADWFFADTASGNIALANIKAKETHVDSASGNVGVQGEIGQVTVDTASGDTVVDMTGNVLSVDSASGSIRVSMNPTADGSIYLQTASGSIQLAVPESADQGYSIDASTTSGSVEIALKDGKASGNEEGTDVHFVTNNYSQRAKKTAVDARSTSGNVDVGPK